MAWIIGGIGIAVFLFCIWCMLDASSRADKLLGYDDEDEDE